MSLPRSRSHHPAADGTDDPGPTASDRAEGAPSDPAPPTGNASSRQLLKNFASSYLTLGLSIVLSVILTPIVLRSLGTSGYGLWIVIAALGTYVGLLDAGVTTAAVQQIAELTAVGDARRLPDMIATAQAFYLVTGFIAAALGVVAVPVFGDFITVPHSAVDAVHLSLVLTGVFTALTFLANGPQAALYGAGRSDRASLLGLLLAILTQGTQIIVVLIGGGLVALFAVTVVSAFFSYPAFHYLARGSGALGGRRGRPSREMLRILLRRGRRNAIVAVGGTLAYNLDTVTLGLILPVRQVTPYDIALSTGNLTRNLATTGTNLLLPTYAHFSALDESEGQFRLFSRAILASMAVASPIVVALAVFGQRIVHLWLGTVPAHTNQVIVAINIAFLLQLPGQQSLVYLAGVGRTKLMARLAIPLAVLNLGLSIPATFLFGPVGPVIGSLPQIVVIELILLPIICCRIIAVPYGRYLREAMLPIIVPLIVGTGVAEALRRLTVQSDLWACGEAVIVTTSAWAALSGVLLRVDPTLRSFMRSALRRRARTES